jgi:putative transposase
MTAIIDWHSRYIVGFTLSNTLEKAAVIETVKKAIKKHGNSGNYQQRPRLPVYE